MDVKIYAFLTSATERREWLVLRAAADLSQVKAPDKKVRSSSLQKNTGMVP
jgi:hypothetical protein